MKQILKLTLWLFLLTGFTLTLQAQNVNLQQKQWFLNESTVDFSTPNAPTVSYLPQTYPIQTGTGYGYFAETSNGYRLNDQLYFYTAYNQPLNQLDVIHVSNGTPTLIGSIPLNDPYYSVHLGRELNIIPYVCNNNRQFLIVYDLQYYNPQGTSVYSMLMFNIVTISQISGSLSSSYYVPGGVSFEEGFYKHEMATTRVRYNESTYNRTIDPYRLRYLYFTHGKEIRKATIRYDKLNQDALLHTNYEVIYTAESVIDPIELELSYDGTKLAWTDKRHSDIYILNLNHNGNLVSSQIVRGGTNSKLAGIEFSPDGKDLFVGRKITNINFAGVFAYNFQQAKYSFVNGTENFFRSHLESAYKNGVPHLYAASADYLMELNLQNKQVKSYAVNSYFPFNQTKVRYYSQPSDSDIYSLPDQIDGEETSPQMISNQVDLSHLTGTVCQQYLNIQIPNDIESYRLILFKNGIEIYSQTGLTNDYIQLSSLSQITCGSGSYHIQIDATSLCSPYSSIGTTPTFTHTFLSNTFQIACTPQTPIVSFKAFEACNGLAKVSLLNSYPVGYQIAWSDNINGPLPALDNQTIVYLPEGEYTVSVVNLYNATSYCYIQKVFTIKCPQTYPIEDPVKKEVENIINIYPNPGKMQTNISSEIALREIIVTNTYGKLIFKQAYPKGILSLELPVDLWEKGLYIFQLKAEDGKIITKRFSKE
ncbi:MAG: T9SS type A sorting domain-containing protein [Raineya sp.]|jgi:hypothetical protein|nr:T9SS type A sorting domain-containing protein [Raineya sp.]